MAVSDREQGDQRAVQHGLRRPIVADSAEPKSIAELQQHGHNVIPYKKGADSVDFGIKHVQGVPIS